MQKRLWGEHSRYAKPIWANRNLTQRLLRRSRPVALTLGLLALGTALPAETLIIGNDAGGRIDHRQQIIQRIKQAGDRVEIRGGYCNSACTMFLGLPNMCISASTVFGFHGPSSQFPGFPLQPKTFERWSRVMADHYPQPLRSWFLTDARYELEGIKRVRGRDIIQMGVAECR